MANIMMAEGTMIIVRFLANHIIVEELLFCKCITERAKAQDIGIFEITDKFIVENSLDIKKCTCCGQKIIRLFGLNFVRKPIRRNIFSM